MGHRKISRANLTHSRSLFNFRKSKLKLDENDEAPEYKIKKEIPSTSALDIDDNSPPPPPPQAAATSSEEDDEKQQQQQNSLIKLEKKDDIWECLENGGQFRDLLPTGVIKNSSKLRFDVKEISLTEDV
jgi:hypothetical protein